MLNFKKIESLGVQDQEFFGFEVFIAMKMMIKERLQRSRKRRGFH